MKLFISWSGERSRLLAEGMRKWLPGVINAVEPWLSSNDIDPGARWGPELAIQLETTRYGIICVTGDNLNAPWLLFEAGALSKYVVNSRVVPLILDLKPAEIKGPLAQFQAVQTTENDIKKLITSINQTVFDSGEKGIDKTVVDEAFKLWWPQLKKSIDDIPKTIESVRQNERSEREMIEEILVLVRSSVSVQLDPVDREFARLALYLDEYDKAIESMPGFKDLPQEAQQIYINELVEKLMPTHKTSAKNLKRRNPEQQSRPSHE
jgi:hypothetical protein